MTRIELATSRQNNHKIKLIKKVDIILTTTHNNTFYHQKFISTIKKDFLIQD